MARAYMLTEINHLGGDAFYAEERSHEELVECYAGAFLRPQLIFSGCKTSGEFWKWQESPENNLEMRFWDEKPTDEERRNTPWRVYEKIQTNEDGTWTQEYLTEEEFQNLQEEFPIRQMRVENSYRYVIREHYVCNLPKIEIIRSRT